MGSLAFLRVPTIETLAASASHLGAFKSPSSTDSMISGIGIVFGVGVKLRPLERMIFSGQREFLMRGLLPNFQVLGLSVNGPYYY